MNPTFQGEVQLAGWTESHTSGAKVTFWLPDASDLDVFRGMTAKKGNHAGHRFMCVLVEIGDDERPVTAPQAEKPKGGPLAKLAGMWCNDPQFQQWLGVTNADAAAKEIYQRCGISSRAELDHDQDAAAMFAVFVRHPYREFLGEIENA